MECFRQYVIIDPTNDVTEYITKLRPGEYTHSSPWRPGEELLVKS